VQVSNGVCGSALEFFVEDSGACVRSPDFEVNRGLTTSLWVWLHSTGERPPPPPRGLNYQLSHLFR
jgi:hypothetical protein